MDMNKTNTKITKIKMEIVLNALSFAAGVSAILVAGACGQNTTISRDRAPLDTMTHEAKIPNPVNVSAANDEATTDSNANKSSADEGENEDIAHHDSSSQDSSSSNDSSGQNTETITVINGIQTVVIYRAGQYEKTIDAQPLDEEEFQELDPEILPYVSTMNHPRPGYRHLVPAVNLGTRWGRNDYIKLNGRRHNLGQYTPYLQGRRPTVKDAQVIFKLPFRNLPPRNVLEDWDPSRNDNASLHLMVSKISNERSKSSAKEFMNTELICFLGVNWCSGSTYTAQNWQANLNESFFKGRRPETENTYFNEQFLTEHEVHGNRLYFYGEVKLSFDELLRRKSDNSQIMGVLDLIYGDTPADQPLISRDLYIVVADDTYVSKELTHFRMRFRVKDGTEVVIRPETAEASKAEGTPAK